MKIISQDSRSLGRDLNLRPLEYEAVVSHRKHLTIYY
jgi:hypothetical protein